MDEDDDEVVNRPAAHRPILVVCYTNHALDQFLEGIHEYHPDGIVRVGGRSNSEKMQECSLRQKKRELQQAKAMPREIRRAFFEIHQEVRYEQSLLNGTVKTINWCYEGVNSVVKNPDHDKRIMKPALAYTMGPRSLAT